MLQNLHVKNFALIEEVDLDFQDGLNILSGETGAGKSLLLGSLGVALGGRMDSALMRRGEKEALVELVFGISDGKITEMLKSMDIDAQDGQLIISRRITGGRTVSRMNGVSVTVPDIKKIASMLLDIHGQHENQSLLSPEKQLEIIDSFGGDEITDALSKTGALFTEYRGMLKELESFDMDDAARLREQSLLLHELNEIRQAALREGEEEELETSYRRMLNSRKIIEAVDGVRTSLGDAGGASDLVGRAIRELSDVLKYDEALSGMNDTLSEIESLLSDINMDAAAYMEEMSFSDADFEETEKRLDLIHALMAKYGSTSEEIEKYAADTEERLAFLENYEIRKNELAAGSSALENELEKACAALSALRAKAAKNFEKAVKDELRDLNFNKVDFEAAFSRAASYRADGYDTVSFNISLNPGEPVRPLSKVASGGELSRIMLAIRTLLADKDSTETLIFDEIDTGISGVTAARVAEKMAVISGTHQLICVTHLAQIASMADANYIIEKESDSDSTRTHVRLLDEEETVREIARILGGTGGDDSAAANAAEMRARAREFKQKI